LSYELPDRLARLVGASRASVSVAGRNLHTWSRFKGIDPENASALPDVRINSAGSVQQSMPQLTHFVTRVSITF